MNPNSGTVSDCHFEYGPTETYGSSATCVPAPGSGSSPVSVAASIGGLAANTTYHFRVSATNPGGTSKGSDQAFMTLPASTEHGPHWVKGGVRLKEGTTASVISWGIGGVNLIQEGPAGEINCKTVGAGTIENPDGSGLNVEAKGPPGVGRTLASIFYECKAPKCEAEIAASPLGTLGFKGVGFVQAYNFPWYNELRNPSPPYEEIIGAPGNGNFGQGFPEGFPAKYQAANGLGNSWGASGAIGFVVGCETFPNPEDKVPTEPGLRWIRTTGKGDRRDPLRRATPPLDRRST